VWSHCSCEIAVPGAKTAGKWNCNRAKLLVDQKICRRTMGRKPSRGMYDLVINFNDFQNWFAFSTAVEADSHGNNN